MDAARSANAICGNGAAPPLSIGVLAGGMSTRMGVDKALLSLTDGGPPLLQLVLERTRPLTDDCFVVASERPAYARFGARVVPDARPGLGALGGLATAIAAARHEHVLVVACDMPLLSLPLLRHMAGVERDYDVLIPALPGESRQGRKVVYQTLHAIYGRNCLAPIERRLDAGRLQVIGFFDEARVWEVDEATVRRFDPELHSFVNANTPAAAEAARRLLELETAAGNDLARPTSPIIEGGQSKGRP